MSSDLERLVLELVEQQRSRLYGKYRGVVADVEDPHLRGYIRARVPGVYGDAESPWAAPAAPFAGAGHGLVAIPEVGDGVWIEFEAGDPARPIWSGAWWADDEMPAQAGVRKRAWVSAGGHRLVLDDDADELRLEHASGPKITLSGDRIALEVGGKIIEITATSVKINGGNLEVT